MAEPAIDPTVVREAHEWIDRVNAGRGISGNWRLQVIQKRWRRRRPDGSLVPPSAEDAETCASGTCDSPWRIRRFVNGCPWALVDEAIRYLVCLAPYTGLIYNGLVIRGTYRPTLTQWRRDEQDVVDEQRPQNGTYTLIQDLVQMDCPDEEESVTGASCSEETVTEWHWDDDAPGSLADYATGCEQGVAYAIDANRKDDGTFDWRLVKKTAYTQHTPPSVVQCDCSGTVTQETWDNLYGGPGEGFRAKYCGAGGDGEPVDGIPPEGCSQSEPGVQVQVQLSQNPDCTYKAVVTRRESFEHEESWIDGTSCRRTSTTVSSNARTAPSVPSPSVGETVRARVRRNDDCTYDSEISVQEAPEELEYGWRDGSACRPRTVSRYQNLKRMPSVPEPGPGETLTASLRRNEDCTWDAEFEVRKPAEQASEEWTQGSACRPERVTLWMNAAERPEVPVPGPGETVQASLRRNDDCTWDGQVAVRESPAEEVLRWTEGSACRPREVTRYESAREVPEVPAPGPGEQVQARVSRNEDCTYDAEISVTKPYSGAAVEWTDGPECRRRRHRLWTDVAEMPVPAPAEDGQTVDFSLRFDPSSCTWSGEQVVVDPESSATVVCTAGSALEQVTETHEYGIVGTPECGYVAQAGETVSVRLQRNSDCTWDRDVSVRRSLPCCVEFDDGTCRRLSHTTVCRNVPELPEFEESGAGRAVNLDVSCNEDGTYSYRQVVTEALPVDTQEFTWQSGLYDVTHREYYNAEAPWIESDPDPYAEVSNSFQLNEMCLYDGSSTVRRKVRSAGSGDEDYLFGPVCPGGAAAWSLVDCRPAGEHDVDAGGRPFVTTWENFVYGSLPLIALARYLSSFGGDERLVSYRSLGSYSKGGSPSQVFVATIRKTVAFTSSDRLGHDPDKWTPAGSPFRREMLPLPPHVTNDG